MTRLAAVATAVLLAVGCAGSHNGASVAAIRHHYFLVGKRVCGRALAKPHVVVEEGGVIQSAVEINTNGFPAKYRKAVWAGCRAAQE